MFFENRHGLKISVLVEGSGDELVFVMPGYGGFKSQPHIRTIVKAFVDNGFVAVSFDPTHSVGESDGEYEKATTTSYLEDLEDVINWAKDKIWCKEPFFLCGHSLGGISVLLYTEKYYGKVKALAPISTVVSGKLSLENAKEQNLEAFNEWKETGWKIKESKSKPGLIKRSPWSHMEDRMKYDVLSDVNKLGIPILLVVGSEDYSTPLKYQQILYDALSCEKELNVIEGAPHTFRKEEHLKELYNFISEWVKKVKK